MGVYILRRVCYGVLVWFLISICAFGLVHLARTNPAAVMFGGVQVSHSQVVRLDRQLGLTRPIVDQYLSWLGGVLRGKLGESYFQHAPVTSVLLSHGLVTATIAVPAIIIAGVVGLIAGVVGAARANSAADSITTALSAAGMAIPEFWLALLMILAVSVGAGRFPPLGYVVPWHSVAGWLRHVVLPATTLGLIEAAPIARLSRTALLEVLSSDFIRTARAKGLSRQRVLFVHALRSALLPVLTTMGIVVTLLLSGDFAVEIVFNIPGLGYLLVNSALTSDYPVVQGGVLLVGTAVVLVNLFVDLAYAWADPQVRYK